MDQRPGTLRQAGVPDGTGFATKPQLAQRMTEHALDAGTPAARAAADEVYGDNPALRSGLETRARLRPGRLVLSPHPRRRPTPSPHRCRRRHHPQRLIPLTCNEIQRLFTALLVRPVFAANQGQQFGILMGRAHHRADPASLVRNEATPLFFGVAPLGCGEGRQLPRLGTPTRTRTASALHRRLVSQVHRRPASWVISDRSSGTGSLAAASRMI
ncbi:transposase [Streptomyces olivochromogenes]|uniref:transposase n=1 Tax=Streptomyces olivochromogenes TaxID=1963 RepID=UPI0036978996